MTYAKHVAPVLQKRCQECHRPGDIAPFSLLTYDDAKKRTQRIREAVLEQRMPPGTRNRLWQVRQRPAPDRGRA